MNKGSRETGNKAYCISYTDINLLTINIFFLGSLFSNLVEHLLNYNLLNKYLFEIVLTSLFINSFSICSSYYTIFLFDNTCYDRFAKVKKLKRENLKYFNYVVHILPLLLVFTFWVNIVKELNLGNYAGFPSLIFNLSWGYFIVGGIDLSNVYVYLDINSWKKLWIINIMTHLVTGISLNYLKENELL